MSAFASFFLIDASDLDELLENCWPERIETVRRRFFFFTSTEVEYVNRLPWFLDRHGEELAEFSSSGFIFEDLERFLNDHQTSLYPDFRRQEREELARFCYDTVAVYDVAAVEETLSSLGGFNWDSSRFRELAEPGGDASYGDSELVAKSALDHFIGWIRAVEAGKVGVFLQS